MLVGMLLSLFALQGIGPPLPAPVPPPQVTVRNEITVEAPPPDPEVTAQMAGWSFSGIIVTVIAPTFVKWTDDMLNVPDFYRTTPPDWTYRHDGVRAMADIVRTAALALIGLAILAWAIQAILTGSIGEPWRLLTGIALALGNLTWWQWGIDLNNAICAAISAPELRSIVGDKLSVPTLTADPVEAFGPSVLVIVYAIVLILLIVAMWFRLGFLDLLIAAGALGLFMKSSEQTDHFYSVYTGLAVGTLFGQVLVVIALKLAPILTLAGGGIASTVLGLVVIMLARRMPGLLSNRLSQQGGGIGRMGLFLLLRRAVARV